MSELFFEQHFMQQILFRAATRFPNPAFLKLLMYNCNVANMRIMLEFGKL